MLIHKKIWSYLHNIYIFMITYIVNKYLLMFIGVTIVWQLAKLSHRRRGPVQTYAIWRKPTQCLTRKVDAGPAKFCAELAKTSPKLAQHCVAAQCWQVASARRDFSGNVRTFGKSFSWLHAECSSACSHEKLLLNNMQCLVAITIANKQCWVLLFVFLSNLYVIHDWMRWLSGDQKS